MALLLDDLIAGKDHIAIAGHLRPDGDCVGSVMSTYLYVRKVAPRAKVTAYLQEPPKVFSHLPNVDDLVHEVDENNIPVHDLFITVDCADEERLGFAIPVFRAAKESFCLDHHISNQGFAMDNHIVPDASSTCEVIYTILDESKIDQQIATYIYIGIAHDTGCFRFQCTSPQTMEIAAALMRKGINITQILDQTFYNKTFQQTRITGHALDEAFLLCEGKVLASYLTQSDMDAYGVSVGELDGIVAQLWMTSDIEVALFMYQVAEGEYKVSMRSSEKVDVSKACAAFGGGGHRLAAGCNFFGHAEEALTALSKELLKQL